MNNQRPYFIYGFVILIASIFIVQLFNIQIVDKKYKLEAQRNTRKSIEIDAYRGRIVDRNGSLLVHNAPIFDLNVTTRKAEIEDTARFCEILGISKTFFEQRMSEMKRERGYSSYRPYPFLSRIPLERYAIVQDIFDYTGFEFRAKIERTYPHPNFALGLGYLAKISSREYERDQKGDKYYRKIDYLGKTGIEKAYEKQLRGNRGVEYVLVNVKGIKQGAYAGGVMDTVAHAGINLQSTLDIDLQAYGERLMNNKLGSIVAIEPSTGEVLALVSSPGYDPNRLTGPEFSRNFDTISKDPNKPLINRAIYSQYPPGSIFKIAQSLVLMKNKIIGPDQKIFVRENANVMGDHAPSGMYGVREAVQYSSNSFYLKLMKKLIEQKKVASRFEDARIGLDIWSKDMYQLGLGKKLNIDLPSESKGLIPTTSYYDRWIGKNEWAYSNFRSVSIGQGEVLMTPLQMANLSALIANRGYFYRPHLIRPLQDTLTKYKTGIDTSLFLPVIDGMQWVVEAGTARRAITKGITICGKTGTVENGKGKDHSVFIAFAPRENPKIAIACIVENSGNYGGTWAAPISSLMIEKYLNGEISDFSRKWKEPRLLEANFIKEEDKEEDNEE